MEKTKEIDNMFESLDELISFSKDNNKKRILHIINSHIISLGNLLKKIGDENDLIVIKKLIELTHLESQERINLSIDDGIKQSRLLGALLIREVILDTKKTVE